MQKINWILFHNAHTGLRADGPDKELARLVQSNFCQIDFEAATYLKPEGEGWIPFKPHGGKDCVQGFKRVAILQVRRAKPSVIVLRYRRFDPNTDPHGEELAIRPNSIPSFYNVKDEDTLARHAEGKPIYIGLH